jgi:biotin synthase
MHDHESVLAVIQSPFLDLVHRAAHVHREHHDPREIQRCTLLSIKTGGCPEDCGYCPQSARHPGAVKAEPMLSREDVRAAAVRAQEAGATRFCMGAAWRQPKDGPEFERVLDMVRDVRGLGMEACVTLGMLTPKQAVQLGDAGLTAYNHNLDTSERFYDSVISTRSYQERLDTLRNVQDAGVHVCSGGILGMGETPADRAEMLCTLANMDPQPESVPVNSLVRSEGTPLSDQPDFDPLDLVRTVATARILMPHARVRLAAGRLQLDESTQALCFLAGANSIFFGEKLLTTPNPAIDTDVERLERFGLRVSQHAHS